MGNRHGSARCAGEGSQQPASLPPLPPLTAEAPPPHSSGSAGTGDTETSSANGNPGEFEDLGKKVKEQINPQVFEGCKVALGKGLSKFFQTTHTVTLGSSTQPANYQYGVTYVGSKKLSENDYRPIMLGEISTSGSFSALFMHQLAKVWKLKLNAQAQESKWVAYQGSLDYQGSDFTASLTLANPNLLDGSVVGVLQYLQAVTPRLSLGTELMVQRGGGMEAGMISVGGAYRCPDWEASARMGLHSWHLTYLHKLKDLDFIAECEGSLMQGNTVAAIGYKMDLGAMTVRGRINSLGVIAATIEKRLDPIPGAFVVSGRLNHWTDESKFGIGLLIG